MVAAVTFNLRSNIDSLSRDLKGLQRKQIPFAAARALTTVGKDVVEAETKRISSDFDSPTPFTKKAVGMTATKKGGYTVTIYVRDRQEQYLDPYLDPHGGPQVLGSKKAILMPIDIAVNQFGNIPANTLKMLKGRSDVFIGTVRTKSGPVAGVWQRPAAAVATTKRERGRQNLTGSLKLLVRFTRPVEVGSKHNLDWFENAQKAIEQLLPDAWHEAIEFALRTAK